MLLDTVEFSKGSRTNRVEVLVGGKPHWITAPMRRAGSAGPIREVLIDDERDWRAKVVKTLRQNYPGADAHAARGGADRRPRASGWRSTTSTRSGASPTGSGSTTPIVRASELGVEGRATELLIDIVRAVGGGAYLAGGGAGGYQEDERFARGRASSWFPRTSRAPHGLSIVHALLSGEVPAARR